MLTKQMDRDRRQHQLNGNLLWTTTKGNYENWFTILRCRSIVRSIFVVCRSLSSLSFNVYVKLIKQIIGIGQSNDGNGTRTHTNSYAHIKTRLFSLKCKVTRKSIRFECQTRSFYWTTFCGAINFSQKKKIDRWWGVHWTYNQ